MNSSESSSNIESEKTLANSTPNSFNSSASASKLEPIELDSSQFNHLKQDGSKRLAFVRTNEQQHESKEEAKTNELMTRETGQRRDRDQPDQQVVALTGSKRSEESNKTSETDESKAANGKSVSFDELPHEQTGSGGGDGATGFEALVSDEPARSDELDYSEPGDWSAGHSLGGSINRRAFFVSNSLTEAGRNGTSRLASLISHKPLGSGLRNLARNSTVLRALEKRRLRQRERLKRIKMSAGGGSSVGGKQLQLDKSTGLSNNKKRDLEQAQTRQSLTTSSTTLGPGQSLLALNGVSGNTKNVHSNLSLKTNAFKHLPSLASGSTQISSAIQRLISNKLGLTSATANANPDLTAFSNHTLNELVGGKQSSLFGVSTNGDTSSQLLQLNQDLDEDDNDQADISSTSASDQHQHTLQPTHANFGGATHHFDVSADNGQETDEAEQLDGDRLAELLQSGHWTQSGGGGPEDHRATRSSPLSLQAAQRQNKLLRMPVNRGKQSSALDKQTIPIEIIGLDPRVTNSILYGTNSAQASEQQQGFNQNQFMQTNGNGQSLDEGPNSTGGQQFNQMGSASELNIQENSPHLAQFANVFANNSAEFKSDGQQARKVEQIQALDQDSSATASAIRPNPSSVLHIHHFHHTTEPDKTRPTLERQQEVESAEQADQTNRPVGELRDESRPAGGQASELAADTPNKVPEAPNEQQNQGESVELQTATEQSEQQQQAPGAEDKTEAKRVRFVTRNSLRDKNPTATGGRHLLPNGQNVDFLLQSADQNQMSSNRFMPMRPQQQSPSFADNNLQTLNAGSEANGSGDNGMLMVAYRPTGRVRASSSDHQLDSGSLQQQPFRVQKQPDFWLTSLVSDGQAGNRSQLIISEGGGGGESSGQRPQLTPIRQQNPGFNEASESNHMLMGSNQIVDRQRQRLVNAAMVAATANTNSLTRPHYQVPLSITSQPKPHHPQQQQEVFSALLKQQQLNPALMMQLRDKPSAAVLAIESANAMEPNWTSEDERLLSQYTELTGRRNNNAHRQQQHVITANNLPNTLNLTSLNQQQQRLRPEMQNPFQNHYQNFVENLVMMKRLQQKNEESQLQAPMNQAQLNSRLTNNELAAVMQEQLSKQMLNRTLPLVTATNLHRNNPHQQNTTSGRFELAMASDRAPAKMSQQQMASVNSTLLRTATRPNNQTTFSANDNFHVPNTSSFGNKLQAPAVIFGASRPDSPISSSPPIGQGSSVEISQQTRTDVNFNATARPTLASETRESFMDSAEGVSNLALAFIFVVSLLTFIMIAVSMVYRRRRGSATRRESSRAGDAPSSSARLSIAQRTRHLMRSNMFAGVARSRGSRVQPGEIGLAPSSNPTTSSASSSTSSLTSTAHLNRVEQETSVKTLNLDRRNHLPRDLHQTSSATRSAWAKHLKPVLRRAPTLQADAGRCMKAANCLQQQLGASLVDSSKYVRGNQGGANIGNTLDVPRRRETGAPPGGQRGNKSDKYQTANVETATNLTNDGTLASNPDSDIRTLNTRLQKAAYLQHEPAAVAKQPADGGATDTAHYKKQHQMNRRAY